MKLSATRCHSKCNSGVALDLEILIIKILPYITLWVLFLLTEPLKNQKVLIFSMLLDSKADKNAQQIDLQHHLSKGNCKKSWSRVDYCIKSYRIIQRTIIQRMVKAKCCFVLHLILESCF